MAASKFTVNPELTEERNRATFDIAELTTLVDEDKSCTDDRREIEVKFANDPNKPDVLCMLGLNADDFCNKSIKTAKHFESLLKDMPGQVLGNTQSLRSGHIRSIVYPSENPLIAHALMFIPTIQNQGNEEQQVRWLTLLEDQKMFGSYAQTELGHGTNMRGLETTATYDPETEEFILNSPTVTSIKCWPGGLGRTSNFAIVIAQLYTKGQCHGLHSFMVQLRNLDDHSVLPGITMGDIGPKMGLAAADNGFLRLENVRIPRNDMFMRYAKVLKDGMYIKPTISRTSYGALVLMRIAVVSCSMMYLAQACTIAVRYSAVRRQGYKEEGTQETKILDYQTQQYRLIPQVALAYGFIFTFQKLRYFYLNLLSNYNNASIVETHALTSGLKALSSHTCAISAETCRQACGGVGYLLASRLPVIYTGIVAACTYEGDNVVLLLQTARYLVKSYKAMQNGDSLPSTVQYLTMNSKLINAPSSALEEIVFVYEKTAAGLVDNVCKSLANDAEKGIKPNISWDNHAIALVKCATIHTQVYVMQCLHDFLSTKPISGDLRRVLDQLFQLLGIFWLSQNTTDFIMYGGFTTQKIEELNSRIPKLLSDLRPNIVALVDAFDFCDDSLHSVIGCYDGRVYERLFEYWSSLPENKKQFQKKIFQTQTQNGNAAKAHL